MAWVPEPASLFFNFLFSNMTWGPLSQQGKRAPLSGFERIAIQRFSWHCAARIQRAYRLKIRNEHICIDPFVAPVNTY